MSGAVDEYVGEAIPPLIYFCLILYAIFPWRKRKVWWRMVLNVVISPFGKVCHSSLLHMRVQTVLTKISLHACATLP